MRLEAPRWWYGSRPSDRLKAALLSPASWLYGFAANVRFALTTPYRSSIPVICIGNFTAGGAGKTPLAIYVAQTMPALGCKPAFLTRGYGGRIAGPHQVDAERDTADDVGDEALLLARVAPTFVSADRPAGARAIEASGADLIIMDDGFQNPSLFKNLALVVVDEAAGLGNGRVLPAGPLRAPLSAQLKRADAVIAIGGGRNGTVAAIDSRLPVLEAEIAPAGDVSWLSADPVLAFSGIGRPSKFFATLERLGARVIGTAAFPDHHCFSSAEAADLLAKAEAAGARLVTTEKDRVRIGGGDTMLAKLRARSHTLPITLEMPAESRAMLKDLLLRVFFKNAASQTAEAD